MTKKKRGHPDLEEVLARPWCYYCERDFDDLKILINHQKAKHFKCDKCGRRLNTAGGLNVHMNQVHKENLTAIENALPNRAGLDIEIFGMEGIPEDIVQQHNQRVLTNFHQAEAERRAATGNAAPGTGNNGVSKKPKFESPADLKKRLAEHKAAKLAAEQNGGGSSGASTPVSTQAHPLPIQQPPQAQTTYGGTQQSYAPPPSTTTFSAPQTYAQNPLQSYSPAGYAAPPGAFASSPPAQQPPFGQPPQPFQQPYVQSPQPGFPPQQYPTNTFSPPPPFQGQPQFSNQGYQSQVPQNGYPGQVGPPRPFGTTSPASQFPPQNRTHSPQNGQPQRQGSASLAAAPGLPQRPAVSAPSVNAAQFQQMHQGQMPAQHNYALPPSSAHSSREEYNPSTPQVGMPGGLQTDTLGASSLDDLISSASKQADENAARAKTATPQPSAPPAPNPASKDEATDDKAAKKDTKEKAPKPTRLVYSDNEISPEEKMAAMARYAFTPAQKTVQA